MNIALVIVTIIIVMYVVFTYYPQMLPAGIWRNSFVRKSSRANMRLLEGITGNPNVVPMPVQSYYKTYSQKNNASDTIVVGLHYTDWCGYCKRMKPIWYELKKNLSGPEFSAVVMFENDEDANPTAGVSSYPSIFKMRNGLVEKYHGRSDYDQLRAFILAAK